MDTLYYTELFPLHRFGLGCQFGSLSLIITVPILGMDLCPCKPVYTQFINLNKGSPISIRIQTNGKNPAYYNNLTPNPSPNMTLVVEISHYTLV